MSFFPNPTLVKTESIQGNPKDQIKKINSIDSIFIKINLPKRPVYDEITNNMLKYNNDSYDLKYVSKKDKFFNDLMKRDISFNKKLKCLTKKTLSFIKPKEETDPKYTTIKYLNNNIHSVND